MLIERHFITLKAIMDVKTLKISQSFLHFLRKIVIIVNAYYILRDLHYE